MSHIVYGTQIYKLDNGVLRFRVPDPYGIASINHTSLSCSRVDLHSSYRINEKAKHLTQFKKLEHICFSATVFMPAEQQESFNWRYYTVEFDTPDTIQTTLEHRITLYKVTDLCFEHIGSEHFIVSGITYENLEDKII